MLKSRKICKLMSLQLRTTTPHERHSLPLHWENISKQHPTQQCNAMSSKKEGLNWLLIWTLSWQLFASWSLLRRKEEQCSSQIETPENWQTSAAWFWWRMFGKVLFNERSILEFEFNYFTGKSALREEKLLYVSISHKPHKTFRNLLSQNPPQRKPLMWWPKKNSWILKNKFNYHQSCLKWPQTC